MKIKRDHRLDINRVAIPSATTACAGYSVQSIREFFIVIGYGPAKNT
jgi:hypothetical protein